MKPKQKRYKHFVHKNGVTTYKGIVTLPIAHRAANTLNDTYEEVLPYNWDKLLTRLTFLFAAVTVTLEFYDKVLKK